MMNQTPKVKTYNSTFQSALHYLKEAELISDENIYRIKSNHDLFLYLKETEVNLDKELNKFDPNCNLNAHMEELHNYNAVKDATQSLLGSISMQTGKSVTELHKQFGL